MVNTMVGSVFRVFLFWYGSGALLLFVGSPAWAARAYARLSLLPWVPELVQDGLVGAAKTQVVLLWYWTLPALLIALVSVFVGYGITHLLGYHSEASRKQREKPRGTFWGVEVENFSLGELPRPTVPVRTAPPLVLPGSAADGAQVQVAADLRELFLSMSAAERQLSEEVLQLLMSYPDHYAGQGHGVSLLEHTLNVAAEAASRCSKDFRLPLVAALAHDVGKLITFRRKDTGEWERRGLHSREGARILVTLPGFAALPAHEQDALLLAIKYDHAPQKMPLLRGTNEAHALAHRIINALSRADKSATAAEKDRHLERLKPEDLLWQDFMMFLRDAPVVQKGKPGSANQVNNPEGPYLYIYEAPWREAAVKRMPPEVAAALDLTRRDSGKLAKYTRILLERLRTEGLLLEAFEGMQVSKDNPLWDIQSGTGEKGVVLRGIIVLKADALWKRLNYRLGIRSPYPVQLLAPNANATGEVNKAPKKREEPAMPEVSDALKIEGDVQGALEGMGLTKTAPSRGGKPKLAVPPQGAAPEQPMPAATVEAQLTAKVEPEAGVAESKSASVDAALDLVLALAGQPTPVSPPAAVADVAGVNPLSPVEAPRAEPPAEAKPAPVPGLAQKGPKRPGFKAKPVAAVANTPSSEGTPAHDTATAIAPAALTRSEQLSGIAIADEAAVARYPHLIAGDRYYTEASPMCQTGVAPGTKYTPTKIPSGVPGLDGTAAPRPKRRY